MKRLTIVLILFLTVLSMTFSQFITEPPVIEFDVDFGNNSYGVLRYYGYRPSEDDFWLEIITGSLFNNLISSKETLAPPSYTEIDDNKALDEFVKATMERNNLTVCITLFPNEIDGFTYVVNYSFNNYKTFGFISMDSIGYIPPSVQPPQVNVTTSKYKIVTGRAYSFSISQDELRKRINLQNYNDIVSWLRWGSNNVIESTGVQFDRLINVLVNNLKNEQSAAENTVRNIGNSIKYQWLVDSDGFITEWIIYFKE